MNTNIIAMWKHCKLHSKSTFGGALCVFESHVFVPMSWMCKEQTSVSHSSTESEIISLDAGFRLDGIRALDLWDLIVLVLGNRIQTNDRTGQPVVNCDKDHGPNKPSQSSTFSFKRPIFASTRSVVRV